jgi:hypothetical protein
LLGGSVAPRHRTIYIDRRVARKPTKTSGEGQRVLSGGRKRVHVVLFVPSVKRDGVTAIDQPRWVDSTLEVRGRVFGGATAYPKAKGVWRDDDNGGALVKDEPVVVHCYTTPADIEDSRNLAELGTFCRKMDSRLTRERSVWSWATSTSPSAISWKTER